MELTNALYSTPFPKKVISEAKCKNRIMQQTNVAQALKMLEKAEVKTHFLKAGHLMDKERKFILGMIWSIILDYNLKGLGEENTTAKEGLLIWCRKKTKGYKGVDGKVNNFSRDWKDGNRFLALVDRHTQNKVNYNEMYELTPEEKIEESFKACEELGIPRLLEVSDLTEMASPDEHSVMTYVSEMFKLFSKEDMKENAAEHVSRFLQFQKRIDSLGVKYEQRFDEFSAWVEEIQTRYTDSKAPENQSEAIEFLSEYKKYLVETKPQKMADVVDIQDLYANIQGELRVNGRKPYVAPEGKEPTRLNELVAELQKCESDYVNMVRDTRLSYIKELEGQNIVDEKKLEEFENTFNHFDVDKSGKLDKDEFKAALSGNGIALTDAEFEEKFQEYCDENNMVVKDAYIAYLTEFFSTSDSADSVIKSLSQLGDPKNVTPEMFNNFSQEDIDYLLSKAGEKDGDLAAVIREVF